MANYCATARSNYFGVKDETAFREWADGLDLRVITQGSLFAIHPNSDGGWPSLRFPKDAEAEEEEIDLRAELAQHLVEGDVAVLVEAGAERLRYVCGYAWAVNSSGDTNEISLNDIYEIAYRMGNRVTDASH